jgi:hypothetical protein
LINNSKGEPPKMGKYGETTQREEFRKMMS